MLGETERVRAEHERHGRRRGVIRLMAAAFAVGASACAIAAPAEANVARGLGMDYGQVLWTGTIHHIRTDDLSGSGAGPGSFQRWDTMITVDDNGTRATTTFTRHSTFSTTCDGKPVTGTEDSTGDYTGKVKQGRVKVYYDDRVQASYAVQFVVPQGIETTHFSGACAPADTQGAWSDLNGGPPGNVGFDDEGPQLEGAYGLTTLTYDNTKTLDHSTFEDHIHLNMCGEQSGPQWVDHGPYRPMPRSGYWRFPGSNKIKNLSEPFRGDVQRFLKSLANARVYPKPEGNFHYTGKISKLPKIKIVPYITATLRPDERAWLMNNSYRVAGGWQKFRPDNPPKTQASKKNLAAEQPGDVKPYAHGGVDHIPICWLHQDADGNSDVNASKDAANQMRLSFAINKFGAAYPSNHSKGQAIDMTFGWPTMIAIKDGDGRWRTVPEGASTSSEQMWAIAATFDVIKQTTGDPPHWSLTGK